MNNLLKNIICLLCPLILLYNGYALAPASVTRTADPDKFISGFNESLERLNKLKRQPLQKKNSEESEITVIIRRMQAESKKRWLENFFRQKKVLEKIGIKVDNETLFSNKINGVYISDFFNYYREGLFEEIVKVYLKIFEYQAKREYRHLINRRYGMVNKAMRDFIPHFQNLAEKFFQGKDKKEFLQILEYSTKLLNKDRDHKKRLRQRLVYWATEMEFLRNKWIVPDLKNLQFLDLKIFPVTKDGSIDTDALTGWIFSKQRKKNSSLSNSWPVDKWFQYLYRNQLKSLSEILGVDERQPLPELPRQLNLFSDFDQAA